MGEWWSAWIAARSSVEKSDDFVSMRAWIRSSQLRTYLVREIGDDWWRNPKTGDHLRELWREGTRPSSEDIAARMGFEPLDTGPLIAELGG